eukprot:Hpha_TRINITY_DN12089_c0_g3::TRINITY_DN12089_c0_g3_i2::g.140920::m.140920
MPQDTLRLAADLVSLAEGQQADMRPVRLPPGCYVGPLSRDRADLITAAEEQRFFAPASPANSLAWQSLSEEASLRLGQANAPEGLSGALLRARTATHRRRNEMNQPEPPPQQLHHRHQHPTHPLSSASSWGGTFPFQPTVDVAAAVQRHMQLIQEKFAPGDITPGSTPRVQEQSRPVQPQREVEYSPGDLSGADTGLDSLLSRTVALQQSLAASANSLRVDLARVCDSIRETKEPPAPPPPPEPPRRPPPWETVLVGQEAEIWAAPEDPSARRQAAASAWAAALEAAIETAEEVPGAVPMPSSRSGSESSSSLPDRSMINTHDAPPVPLSTHSTVAPVSRVLHSSAPPADDLRNRPSAATTMSSSTPFLLGDYGL